MTRSAFFDGTVARSEGFNFLTVKTHILQKATCYFIMAKMRILQKAIVNYVLERKDEKDGKKQAG